jgi:competence protein ComEC
VTFVESVRDAIDMRIRSVLSGDVGSIASALITGKRDAITPYLYDAMFVSGIGHVLSISGYRLPAFRSSWHKRAGVLINRRSVLVTRV